MKNKIACLALSLLAYPTVADDFNHRFSVGLDIMRYHYLEQTKDNPHFMSLMSNQFGINGSYTFTYKERLFLQPEAKVNYGFALHSSKYNQKYQVAAEPTLLAEIRLLGGMNAPLGNRLTLSPYTGIGFRFRSEDGTNIQDEGRNNRDLAKRVNHSWYIPLGLKTTYTFDNRWFVSGRGEYDFYLWGKHYHYSPNIAPSPILLKQKKGWGAKAEFLIGKQFEKVAMAVGPYFNSWKVDQSARAYFEDSRRADRGYITRWQNASTEPKNITKETGLRLTFTF